MYSADRYTLNNLIDEYLKEAAAKSENINSHIVGLVAPHAGYEYSGKVAAYGYTQLEGREYKTVYLLGTSHYAAFKGAAVYPAGSWETPLGTVPVQETAAKKLTDRFNFVAPFTPPFDREHSLEVQLPFLQKTIGNFAIVPVLFSSISDTELAALADYLAEVVYRDPYNNLIIASTDLSHYHFYDRAVEMDNHAIKLIRKLDVSSLTKDMQDKTCELCSIHGVVALMTVAQRLNLKLKVLNYANSGDVTGNKGRVVGYTSVAFYMPDENLNLTKEEQNLLLVIARKTLNTYIKTRAVPDFAIKDPRLTSVGGLFITLKRNNSMRGCIGNTRPLAPLCNAASDMTVNASVKDPRFPPVTPEELAETKIEISVLGPLRKIRDVSEIEVGKHGLYLCHHDQCGTLLPQVATFFGWSREEFLSHASTKAGLPAGAWKDKDTRVYIFKAQVFSE